MEYGIRRISGRFKHLDKLTLEQMRVDLKRLLKTWGALGPDELGGIIPISNSLPLWMEVEFLDDVVQFELECNPYLEIEAN